MTRWSSPLRTARGEPGHEPSASRDDSGVIHRRCPELAAQARARQIFRTSSTCPSTSSCRLRILRFNALEDARLNGSLFASAGCRAEVDGAVDEAIDLLLFSQACPGIAWTIAAAEGRGGSREEPIP